MFAVASALVQPAVAAGLDITYTGPTTAQYRAPTRVSAKITYGDGGYSGAKVTFTLGTSSCTTTSGSDGSAACTLSPDRPPGQYSISVRAEGDAGRVGISRTFQIEKAVTSLTYDGTTHIANAEPAKLSARLKDGADQPVVGRPVRFVVGAEGSAQSCITETTSSGVAVCTIGAISQPLNANGTVPLSASFAGDEYYLGSNDTATLLLQYATGRAYGASAAIRLPLLPVTVPPQPDTGQIRTADATSTSPPCRAELRTLVVNADAVCADVVTTLAPGKSTATATLANARIGITGLPLIEVSGIKAVSTSTCEAATGTTSLTLKIAGKETPIPDLPNFTINLGVARLIVNEQVPVQGADYGVSVNAVHLRDAAGLIDVVLASAASDAHNCAP